MVTHRKHKKNRPRQSWWFSIQAPRRGESEAKYEADLSPGNTVVQKRKKPCKAEAWLVFARTQMCMFLISRQRAESSKQGSIGGSTRSIFTNVCLPRSFSAWEDFRVVVRSLLLVPAARGNSLQLRINHSDAPRRLVEKGGASVRTTRTESRLWSHFEVERNSQRHRLYSSYCCFSISCL